MTKPGGFSVGDVIVQKDSDLPREYKITSVGKHYYGAYALDTGRGADLTTAIVDETYKLVRHEVQPRSRFTKKQGRKLDL